MKPCSYKTYKTGDLVTIPRYADGRIIAPRDKVIGVVDGELLERRTPPNGRLFSIRLEDRNIRVRERFLELVI